VGICDAVRVCVPWERGTCAGPGARENGDGRRGVRESDGGGIGA